MPRRTVTVPAGCFFCCGASSCCATKSNAAPDFEVTLSGSCYRITGFGTITLTYQGGGLWAGSSSWVDGDCTYDGSFTLECTGSTWEFNLTVPAGTGEFCLDPDAATLNGSASMTINPGGCDTPLPFNATGTLTGPAACDGGTFGAQVTGEV